MEKRLKRNNSTVQFDKYNRGCILAILPLQFHGLKKFLPYTKHKNERHFKDYLKTQSKELEGDEATECLRESISSNTSKDSSLSKCIVPDRRRLQRVNASRRLDASISFLDDLMEQDILDVDGDAPQFSRESSSETYGELFDGFKIDKKLLSENNQKNLYAEKSDDCPGVLESQRKVTLRRSSSCSANKSCSRGGSLKPSKLEDKLNEVWSFSSSMDSFLSSSTPFSSTTTFSSHQSDYMLPRSCSMVCKLPSDILGELSTDKSSQRDHEWGDYASVVRKYKLNRIRRVSSLFESLEWNSHLLENSLSRDAELHQSNSLRFSNEDGVEDEPGTTDPTISETKADFLEANTNVREVKRTLASLLSHEEHCPIRENDGILGFISENKSYEGKLDELQCQSGVDSQEELENIKAAIRNPDNPLTENVTCLHNTLQQLGVLSARKESSGFMNDSDNQLLSDLLNEVVVDAYNEGDGIWPTPLCFNCHLHPPPPTEHHFFSNVLSRMEKIQRFSLNATDRIVSVVAYDLATNTEGWMNLQADAESLGLEFEEIITGELIEELIYEQTRDAWSRWQTEHTMRNGIIYFR